jgi:hypothetical protein
MAAAACRAKIRRRRARHRGVDEPATGSIFGRPQTRRHGKHAAAGGAVATLDSRREIPGEYTFGTEFVVATPTGKQRRFCTEQTCPVATTGTWPSLRNLYSRPWFSSFLVPTPYTAFLCSRCAAMPALPDRPHLDATGPSEPKVLIQSTMTTRHYKSYSSCDLTGRA